MKAIGEYVAQEYTGTGEFHMSLVELNLPMLVTPPLPDPANAILMELWKMDLKEYHKSWKTKSTTWPKHMCKSLDSTP